MKQIRLALIGAGATGRAHAAGALAAGGFKIAAIVDPIAERLTAAATQFKAETSAATADEVLAKADIDAVCLCVPTQHHAALATDVPSAVTLSTRPPVLNSWSPSRLVPA